MTGDAARRELLEWLDHFADCVRRRDIAAAEPLFDSGVIAFGTRNECLDGRDALVQRQWRPTWEATRDFRFLPDTIRLHIASDGDCAWASCLWTSRGEPGDRPSFDRTGRATFGFVRDGRWRCTHSHLSMTPSGTL